MFRKLVIVVSVSSLEPEPRMQFSLCLVWRLTDQPSVVCFSCGEALMSNLQRAMQEKQQPLTQKGHHVLELRLGSAFLRLRYTETCVIELSHHKTHCLFAPKNFERHLSKLFPRECTHSTPLVTVCVVEAFHTRREVVSALSA